MQLQLGELGYSKVVSEGTDGIVHSQSGNSSTWNREFVRSILVQCYATALKLSNEKKVMTILITG